MHKILLVLYVNNYCMFPLKFKFNCKIVFVTGKQIDLFRVFGVLKEVWKTNTKLVKLILEKFTYFKLNISILIKQVLN